MHGNIVQSSHGITAIEKLFLRMSCKGVTRQLGCYEVEALKSYSTDFISASSLNLRIPAASNSLSRMSDHRVCQRGHETSMGRAGWAERKIVCCCDHHEDRDAYRPRGKIATIAAGGRPDWLAHASTWMSTNSQICLWPGEVSARASSIPTEEVGR